MDEDSAPYVLFSKRTDFRIGEHIPCRCRVDECNRKSRAAGFCGQHYAVFWRGRRAAQRECCTIGECSRLRFRRGMCQKHYAEAPKGSIGKTRGRRRGKVGKAVALA
jgi:hypothetical protein